MIRHKYKDVNEFVEAFDGETRERLETLRGVIRGVLPPDASEVISYNIPAFKINGKGYLVYFAGYKNHTSLYPVPKIVPKEFEKEIAKYQKGKGTLQFANTDPLPIEFIKQVVKYLAEDHRIRNAK